MSVRSLNGLNGTNTNLIITNNYVARLPIEQTQASCLDPVYIGLKGLSGMGSVNQIMKMNGSGELAWATDNNEIITATLPLLKTNSDISLKGITAFGGVGKILKVNSTNDAFEWGTDDTNPSKWILTGTNLYPISTGTNVVIGETTNSNSRKLFVSGDAEVNDLYAKNILLNNSTTQSYIRFYNTDATNPEYVDLKAISGTTATNHTLLLPADTDGTLAVANSTIAFGDDGLNPVVDSYIFDPRQNSGTPTSVYNVLSYHNNGTETAINNWSASSGLSSHFSINFGGAMKFRFHTDGTIKVGSNAYSFPTNAGTLAVFTEIPTNNSSLINGAEYITATSTDTLTNKSMSYSQLTGTPTIPSNFFSITGSDIYATDTTDNLMLGMSSFFPAAKLGVQGNTWLAGQVTINESALLIGLYFSYLYDTTNGRGVISNPNSTYTNKNILTWADNDVGLCVPQSNGYVNFRFANVIKMTFGESLTKFTGELEITDFVIIGDSVQIGTNALSVYGDAVITGDLTLYTPATGTTLTMPKIKFNSENDNCYMSEQMVSNAPSGDMIWKIGGGDIRMFRDNTPNAAGSNYQALLFLYGSANDNTLYIYAGGTSGSASNIYLNSTTFNGNLPYSGTSDDRLKTEEKLINNATETLMKLRPQTYMKQCHMGTEELPAEMEYNFDKHLESGLIAQEIYYNAPELRHIIKNTEGVEELPEGMDINDLQNDPDWNGLGWSQNLASSVSYTELIPYLIKSNQEQQVELDIYKSIVDKLINSKSFVDFKKSL